FAPSRRRGRLLFRPNPLPSEPGTVLFKRPRLPIMPPMRLKAPQRREQLVEVATKLFAKHGYEATTTAAIAEAAGVTEPILYRHFKNKQEMFVAIVREMSDQTMANWRELVSEARDPSDRIRRVAESF